MPVPQITGPAQVSSRPGTPQVMAQSFAAVQSTPTPQDFSPVQLTLQDRPAQATSLRQLWSPLQRMRQPVAAVQSTFPAQDLKPVQLTLHGMPGGQVTALPQELFLTQSMTHTPPGQPPLQAGGQGPRSWAAGRSDTTGPVSRGTAMSGRPPSPSEVSPPPSEPGPTSVTPGRSPTGDDARPDRSKEQATSASATTSVASPLLGMER